MTQRNVVAAILLLVFDIRLSQADGAVENTCHQVDACSLPSSSGKLNVKANVPGFR